MAWRILRSYARPYVREWRRRTRGLRFLLNLVRLRLRLWLKPVWPISRQLYPEYPADPWPGDADKGNALIRGEFCSDMGGEPYDDFWRCVTKLPPNTQRRLQEFQWLRHLSPCSQRAKAAEFARRTIDEWSERGDIHHAISDSVATRAERLSNCLCYHPLLIEGASQRWIDDQVASYHEEALAMADILRRRGETTPLSVLKCLLFATMVLPSMRFLIRPVNRALRRAILVRFYPDGGHRTRSPEAQRWEVATLLEIRAAMKKRQLPISPEFDDILQRALDVLATLTHGDNKIACFHDSIELPVEPFTNLWQVWRKAKPHPQRLLPDTGYANLKRQDSVVIVDVGYRASRSAHHYAGPLALEFSRAGARAIVNCGAYRGEDENWRQVSYHTAAHSTLSLDHYDAGDVRYAQETFKVGHCAFEERDNALQLVADHYGYADRFGILHERSLSLSEDGKVLRGIDRLRPAQKRLAYANDSAESLYLRFHLHPSVSVEKMTPTSVEIKLKNGELWEFSVTDASLAPIVEESVYLGEEGLPKPSMQIVIKAPLPREPKERFYSWKLEWMKG